MSQETTAQLKARARARARTQLAAGAVACSELAEYLSGLHPHLVAGFLPLPSEVSGISTLITLASHGIDIALVQTDGTNLTFVKVDRDALISQELQTRTSALAVPEPSVGEPVNLYDCDAVLVPALACDLAGARLGRGGGYYDRALTRVNPNVPVIALVHDSQVWPAGEIPCEAHDRRVSAIATSTQLLLLDAKP